MKLGILSADYPEENWLHFAIYVGYQPTINGEPNPQTCIDYLTERYAKPIRDEWVRYQKHRALLAVADQQTALDAQVAGAEQAALAVAEQIIQVVQQ